MLSFALEFVLLVASKSVLSDCDCDILSSKQKTGNGEGRQAEHLDRTEAVDPADFALREGTRHAKKALPDEPDGIDELKRLDAATNGFV